MNKLRQLLNKYKLLSVAAKATIAYTLASLFTKGLGIITTPLFTRIMTPAEIGEFSTFSSWYSMISVVATLSLSSGAFSLAMFEYPEERDKYSSSMIGLSSISTLVFVLIYLVNPEFWNGVLSLNTVEVTVMLAAFWLVPATEYRITRLRFEYKYKQLITISLTNAICGTALAIVAVLLARHFNAENLAPYRILGLYAVLCTMGLVNMIYLIRHGKTLANGKFWKFALINNTPLIVNALAKHVLEVSDRTMITNMVDKSATGIYSTLYTVSTLSLIVWGAIESSLLPYTFENLRNKTEKNVAAIVNPLLAVFAGVCLLLTLVAPEIVWILAPKEYYEAIYIMPPVACGVFFSATYNIFGDILLYHKKTYWIMVSTITAAVANVVLNYIFIGQFGYMAAAYTTLASYIILTVMQYIFMRIVHKGRVFNELYILLLSAVLVGCSIACIALYDYMWIRYAVIVAIAIVAFILRKKIISLFSRMKKKKEEPKNEQEA